MARVRGEEVRTGFWWENPRTKDNLKDLGAEGRISKCIDLDCDIHKWRRDFVNTVQMRGIS